MLRASSVHKICTNRPIFDRSKLVSAEELLETKMGKPITSPNLEAALDTRGLVGLAKEVVKQRLLEEKTNEDPLPDGAKNYLQELWLEKHGFLSFSISEQDKGLQKGRLAENDAIKVLSELHGIRYRKNELRSTINSLTGECDILHEFEVRDVKCPVSWETFRKKDGITPVYYWQLIAYCHLFEATEASIDYILMPTPEELYDDFTKYLSEYEFMRWREIETRVQELPLHQRVKSYSIPTENIQTDIAFMLSRVDKAVLYYDSLDYETCMNMPNNG